MGPAADAAKLFGPNAPRHRVYQPGGIGTHWSGIVSGYHAFVDALESYVSGKTISTDDDDLSRSYMPVLEQWHA
jgi:hypothetical protein